MFDSPLSKAQGVRQINDLKADQPIELVFESGEWTGGVVLTGNNELARQTLTDFMARDPAAQGETPLVRVGSSTETLKDWQEELSGELESQEAVGPTSTQRSTRATGVILQPGQRSIYADCSEWLNPANGKTPDLPNEGRISQRWMQGIYDGTSHEIRGLDKSGYPAVKRFVGYASGNVGFIKPALPN